MEEKEWKVKFTNLQLLKAKMPFYKLEEVVRAKTRQEAIGKVKNDWDCFNHYGNYKASVVKKLKGELR